MLTWVWAAVLCIWSIQSLKGGKAVMKGGEDPPSPLGHMYRKSPVCSYINYFWFSVESSVRRRMPSLHYIAPPS